YIFSGFHCYEKFLQREYSQCRNILLLLLAVSASALVTPYGVNTFLLVLHVMNMQFVQANTIEWMSPNFQVYTFYLFYLVAILAAIAGLGIRLRGPRLVAFTVMMVFGLSHIRGLLMFFLLSPLILARPMAARVHWLRAVDYVEKQPAESVRSDPVLFYLQRRPLLMPAIFLVVAAVVTAFSWHKINRGPPKSISPKPAIDFVQSTGVAGNVFNSFSFGGYLIFVGIPTFIDGRMPPYSDDFVRRYSNAVNLTNIDDAFRLLDEYNVSWVILEPEEPLSKALSQSGPWRQVYSDKDSIVWVRR